MKKTKFTILILLLFVLTIRCSDKGSIGPTVDRLKFGGITPRDPVGNLTGVPDKLDWRLDDTWQSEEKELFADYERYDYSCPVDSNFLIACFPNPAIGYNFKLYFVRDSTTRVDFRIVSQNFEELFSLDSIYQREVVLTFDHVMAENSNMVRVYYRFITENNCCYIGHGDVQLK